MGGDWSQDILAKFVHIPEQEAHSDGEDGPGVFGEDIQLFPFIGGEDMQATEDEAGEGDSEDWLHSTSEEEFFSDGAEEGKEEDMF